MRRTFGRTRLPWVIVVVTVVAGLGRAAPGAAGEPAPTLGEIAAAINRNWDRVESLAVVIRHKPEALAGTREIKRYLMVSLMVEDAETFAFKGPKRYFLHTGPKTAKVIEPDVDPDYNVIPGGREIKRRLDEEAATLGLNGPWSRPAVATINPRMEVAFNGKNYLRKSNGTATVMDQKNVKDDSGLFQQTYLMNIGRPRPDPVNRAVDRKKDRFPDAFDPGGYQVRPDPEEVDGAACVVVTHPGETLWFDPTLGYGLRRRETYHPGTTLLQSRWVNKDWQEVYPGVWLPKVCWKELCGPPLAPEPYRGKPMIRHVYTAQEVSINSVPDALFDLAIEPGMMVADATRLPRESGENQFVLYTMPANGAELDTVVQESLERAADGRAQMTMQSHWWWFISVQVVAVLVVVALLVGRALRRSKA
jgi:hypothetical protein